jgi:hypothetical protein
MTIPASTPSNAAFRFYVAGAEHAERYHKDLGAAVAELRAQAAKAPNAWARLELEREAIPTAQRALHRSAPKGFELVESIYGWTVRYASGLDGFAIARRATGTRENPSSLAEGIAAAKALVASYGQAYCMIRATYGTGDYGHVLSPGDRVTWDETVATSPGW